MFDYLRRVLMNKMTKKKIESLHIESIYAKGLAQYRYHTANINATSIKACNTFESYIKGLVEKKEYYYDMVVLEKEAEKCKVQDRRGDIHEVIDFVSNSYNDLDHIEENREALVQFVSQKPLSSCLSHKIAGLHKVHVDLSDEIADFLGYERAILGTCGYITQISTVFSMLNREDIIFSDQYNHSSIVDGCLLSRAKIIPYRHCDYEDLERLLKKYRKNYNVGAIISDGVFSTKGATANIDKIVALAQKYNCISIIDDTHGIGVVGEKGRGVIDIYKSKPDILTGGFGKAFGSFGGFCVTNRAFAENICAKGRQNVNTSFISPILAAQSLIHLRHYRKRFKNIQGELFSKIKLFNDELKKHNLNCYTDPDQYIHPIFCLYKNTEKETLNCQRRLIEKGFLPSYFPAPVAPYPSLRFSFHRALLKEDIIQLVSLLKDMSLFTDRGHRS